MLFVLDVLTLVFDEAVSDSNSCTRTKVLDRICRCCGGVVGLIARCTTFFYASVQNTFNLAVPSFPILHALFPFRFSHFAFKHWSDNTNLDVDLSMPIDPLYHALTNHKSR